MKRVMALLAIAAACGGAIGCDLPPGGQQVRSRDGAIALSYRPDPAGLAIDRTFSLIVHVCASTPVEGLGVDAHMPQHRHGMNYKPTVAPAGPDAWRANGLLLHMPGQWEFLFGVKTGGKTERLAHSVQVR